MQPAGTRPRPEADLQHRLPGRGRVRWIANPGKSGGACRPGAPGVGYYWPAYALELVRNADFTVH